MVALPPRTIMHGNPADPDHQVINSQMKDWMVAFESVSAGGGLSYVDGTFAALQARTGTSDGEFGLVLSTASEAGVYERASGFWGKVADIPMIFTESQSAVDAAASAAAALISENTAATSAVNAATSETNAATSETNALAAAEASGDVKFYDTKALADAALGGLSEGQVVEVFVDETRDDRRTRYRVESAALVFKVIMSAAFVTWYVDSVLGSDTNDGLENDSAFLTLTKMFTVLASGDKVRLRRHSKFRETLDMTSYTKVDVHPYGSGPWPIVPGRDVAAKGSMSLHSSNTYKITVNTIGGTANRSYGGFFQDGEWLIQKTIAAEGSEAAAIAAVDATPGTFYFDEVTETGWSAGTMTYYFHPKASTDPTSDSSEYEYFARERSILGGADNYISTIVSHGGQHHDGIASLEGTTLHRVVQRGAALAVIVTVVSWWMIGRALIWLF